MAQTLHRNWKVCENRRRQKGGKRTDDEIKNNLLNKVEFHWLYKPTICVCSSTFKEDPSISQPLSSLLSLYKPPKPLPHLMRLHHRTGHCLSPVPQLGLHLLRIIPCINPFNRFISKKLYLLDDNESCITSWELL